MAEEKELKALSRAGGGHQGGNARVSRGISFHRGSAGRGVGATSAGRSAGLKAGLCQPCLP